MLSCCVCFAVVSMICFFFSPQIFYVNPLTWSFRAAVLNEFQSPEYDVCAIEGVDGACGPNRALGQVMSCLRSILSPRCRWCWC